MTFMIREFVAPDDYAGMVAVNNRSQPHHPAVVADYEEHDAQLDPAHHFKRWVAVVEGAPTPGGIVGFAQVAQYTWTYHPHKFNLRVRVDPDYRRQGIGTALHAQIAAFLEALDPITLWGYTRENEVEGLRFAARYGFEQATRFIQSQLDLTAFDPAAFGDLESALAAQGITLRSIADLADDPDRDHKLWRLDMAISVDLPGEEIQEITLAEWRKLVLEDDTLLPEGYIVAVKDGEYLGMSQVVADRASDVLQTGLTGVQREWRRRGLALALKVRALSWAKAQGYPGIKTGNEEGNVAMLAINDRLGFVSEPAGIKLEKVIREEEGALVG